LGVGEYRYQELVVRYAELLVKASRRVSRMAVASLRQQLSAGARVVIVSGCEEHLLRAILAQLGITGTDVIASQVGWRFFGMRVVWHNVGARKIERLASHGILPPWDMAISDSWSDLPILKAARDPALVNANPKLCKRVEKALGRSVRRVEWD
ncbi:MAG: haloacid dehalogenase-like hydrolase, partial [Rhodanobacteraceae bacterium]